MNPTTETTVAAIRDSASNLSVLIGRAASAEAEAEITLLRTEMQDTMLKLVVAIGVTTGVQVIMERVFADLAAAGDRKLVSGMRSATAHGDHWQSARREVPRFFQVAVDHDSRHHTELAPAMLQEMRMMGNLAAMSSGCFAAVEPLVLQEYITVLKHYLTERGAAPRPPQDWPGAGWSSV